MGWNENDIPDLSGNVAVVTGANGGLGLESARVLARKGAHVVMAARNQEKARGARDEILADDPAASLAIVALDLGSLDSVNAAVTSITRDHPAVDILMLNAGLMAMPEGRTEDGFERQFGVNHLGHWVLTAGLLESVLRAESARVVTVTSTAHHFGRAVDPENPHLEGDYEPWKAYGQSKLANFHFAIGLHKEFTNRGLDARSLQAHPGLSNTELQARTVAESGGEVGGVWHRLATGTGMSAAEGALPQLRAATDPDAKGGEMYAPRFIARGAPVRRPILRRVGLDKAIENLWAISERETGVKLDFDSASSAG